MFRIYLKQVSKCSCMGYLCSDLSSNEGQIFCVWLLSLGLNEKVEEERRFVLGLGLVSVSN